MMMALSHINFMGILTNGTTWTVRFKGGRWKGAQGKCHGCECDFDLKMLLHIDMLKLCLKRKHNSTKFFPNIIIFLDKNNSYNEVMGLKQRYI